MYSLILDAMITCTGVDKDGADVSGEAFATATHVRRCYVYRSVHLGVF